ncbi:MAG: TolB family protein, partial [Fidelibacterota bacterium]
NPVNLTHHPQNDYFGDISSDDTRIVFASGDSPRDIYVMDADGKNRMNLTHSDAWDYRPSFQPLP